MMDAKTIDLGKAKTLTLTVEHQDGQVDIITDCQVRPFLEYLRKYAELGRAFIELSKRLPCKGKYKSKACKDVHDTCTNPECHLEKACKLRAKRGDE